MMNALWGWAGEVDFMYVCGGTKKNVFEYVV